MVIRGVFTDSKLSPFEVSSKDTVAYRTDRDYKGLKKGDLVRFDGYDKNFQVVWTFASSSHQDDFEIISINTINGKQVNNSKSMESKKNSMFSGILSKYTAQFMPEQETGVRMSLDGALCVKTDDDEWTGVDSKGDLTNYPEAMTIEMPFIYSIAKPNNKIQQGDIIKSSSRSYGYVLGVNADGTLKIQSFSGYAHTKKAIKDAVMGQATTKVIVNPFNFDDSCGFNPMMLALANGESFDVESLMALSMTPQGKNLFNNTGGGFNMAMLWMLDKNKKQGSNGGVMEMLMMSQMLGGGNNPFANMFGQQPTVNKPTVETQESKPAEPSELEKVNAKVDKLTEAMSSLVNVLTASVQPKKEENK